MWPFSRKPRVPKPLPWWEQRANHLARLHPTGSTVTYMDTPMEVLSHYRARVTHVGVHCYPELSLRYKDNLGVFRTLELTYNQALAITGASPVG
jgi:hypothetical protein